MRKKRRKVAVKRRRGKKNVNYFMLFSYVFILLLVLFIPLAVNRSIIIKKIVCRSQYGECPDKVKDELFSFSGRRLDLAKKEIKKNLDNNYLVESYIIVYKIPYTIEVDIVSKKPKYAIYDLSSKTYYLLDKNGVALENSDQTNLAYAVVNNAQINLGKSVDEKLFFASRLIYNINWLYSIKNGEIKDDSLFVKLENGPVVIFALEGDEETLIGALRLIYSRLNDENKGIKLSDINQIDLRFKNPVLR